MSIYDKASLVHIPSGVKSGTLYNVLPNNADGDFDFTRSSTATRVNKDGLIEDVASGVPRLNYPLLDGVVQDCPHLLLEPARTNVIQYSEDFSQSYWVKSGVSVTSGFLSPKGDTSAFKLIESSSGSGSIDHNIYASTTFVPNSTEYVIHHYIKSGENNIVGLQDVYNSQYWATINLNTGVVLDEKTSGSTEVTLMSNNFYKISSKFTTNTTGIRVGIFLLPNTYSSGRPSDMDYVGDGTSGFYIWGIQLEQGSFPTSYIPTSGSSVTRSADVCNDAGTSDTFNDSEGVLYADISALVDDNSDRKIAIVEGATQNQVSIGYSISSKKIRAITYDGAVKGETFTNACNVLDFNKIAYKYKNLDNQLWVNGFLLDTSNNTNILDGVTLDNLGFDANASDFYGTTKEVIAFNEALSDTELEALTSYDSFTEMATEQLYTIE
jgi:hypothetical protein